MSVVTYVLPKQSVQRFAFILTLVVSITLVIVWLKWEDVIWKERKLSEVEIIKSAGEGCTPKQNVVFLKTHKCASSSLQNIFLRYADRHNLTVVLPPLSNTNYLSSTKPFSHDTVIRSPWSSLGYNVLCHHMVFNYPEVNAIMPADTVYVSIVRDPASVFESLYIYGNLGNFYNMTFSEYVIAINGSSDTALLKKRSGGNLGPSQMMYDFGMNPSYLWNPDEIAEAIKNIDSQFDLIMVAEMFEESLILLKRLLCWDMDDMVSFALNVREDHYRTLMDKNTRDILRQWNVADRLLYEHFIQKFKRNLSGSLNDDFRKQKQELKKRRQDWYSKCIEEITVHGIKTGKSNEKVLSYKLKENAIHNTMCNNLVKPEIQYTNEIRRKQLLLSVNEKDIPVVEEMLQNGVTFPDMIDVQKEDLKSVMHALSKLSQKKGNGFLPVQVRGPQ